MAVRQRSKHELVAALQGRYQRADRAGKARLLDEFCAAGDASAHGVLHAWSDLLVVAVPCTPESARRHAPERVRPGPAPHTSDTASANERQALAHSQPLASAHDREGSGRRAPAADQRL